MQNLGAIRRPVRKNCLSSLIVDRLKVVSQYDLSVSVHVSDGFKTKLDRRMGGWGKLYPVIFFVFWKSF